jgi:hypothetical protein
MTLHAPVLSLLLTVSCCTINLPGDGTDGTGGTTAATGSTGEQPTTGGPPGAGEAGELPPETPPAPPAGATEGIHVSPSGDDATGDGSAQPSRTARSSTRSTRSPGLARWCCCTRAPTRSRCGSGTATSPCSRPPASTRTSACPVSIDENDPVLCVEIDAETAGVKLRGLEVSGGFYAVYLGSQWDYDDTPLDNLTAHDVLIEGCVLHDSGRDVIKIPAGCDDITIRGCEIYNSGAGYPPGTPQDEKNAEGIDVVNSDRLHVADSHIHDTATSCLYAKGGSIGTVIERTRVERCGDLGIVLGFDTSPEFFDRTANPEYYENIGGVVRNCVISGHRPRRARALRDPRRPPPAQHRAARRQPRPGLASTSASPPRTTTRSPAAPPTPTRRSSAT